MSFKTKLKELAYERSMQPVDIAREAGLSVNTVRQWMSGDLQRIDATVAAKLIRLFGLSDWDDLIRPGLYDRWTGEQFDPKDAAIVIE